MGIPRAGLGVPRAGSAILRAGLGIPPGVILLLKSLYSNNLSTISSSLLIGRGPEEGR